MAANERVYVEDEHVVCDGGDPALGHPAIYLTLEKDGKVDCPYCSRRFLLRGSTAAQQEESAA